jgi:hypothetical protein
MYKRSRNSTSCHDFLTAQEFVKNMEKPHKIQALLDYPLPDGNVPGFIA